MDPTVIKLSINNCPIKITKTAKCLGVVIDSKLNFKNHLKTIESKLSRAVGILFKLRPVLLRKALKKFILWYLIRLN